MITFQCNGKTYAGASALDVVRAIERDAAEYPQGGRSIRQFLLWSLERLCDRVPPRDLDLSERLEDDELALTYLYLRDEYEAGELSISKAKSGG